MEGIGIANWVLHGQRIRALAGPGSRIPVSKCELWRTAAPRRRGVSSAGLSDCGELRSKGPLESQRGKKLEETLSSAGIANDVK